MKWQPCFIPRGGAGVAAAAVSWRSGSGRSPVGSIKLCIAVCCRASCRFEHWEWSDVGTATWWKHYKRNNENIFKFECMLNTSILVLKKLFLLFFTCVKELSFHLSWRWGFLWPSGCPCCWRSWSLPRYLQGEASTLEHAIKLEARQDDFWKGISYRSALLLNSTGVLLLKPCDHCGCFWGLNVAAFWWVGGLKILSTGAGVAPYLSRAQSSLNMKSKC